MPRMQFRPTVNPPPARQPTALIRRRMRAPQEYQHTRAMTTVIDWRRRREYAPGLTHADLPSQAVPRPALVVGHPGHELRVYGWLMGARPEVHVLTDGSGSDRASRIASTTALLDDVDAVRGSIYARMSDREIYRAILGGDHPRFIDLAEELAAALV